MPDDEHHDRDISTADRRALELYRRAVLEGPRERAAILPELNALLARHKLALVQTAGGRKYG
jgi:hypothetical protein